MKKYAILLVFIAAETALTGQTFDWSNKFSTPNRLSNSVMCVDDDENVYILAMYANPPGPGAGPEGSILTKYTAAGGAMWTQDIPGLLNGKMAVDHNNDLLIAATLGP